MTHATWMDPSRSWEKLLLSHPSSAERSAEYLSLTFYFVFLWIVAPVFRLKVCTAVT